MSLFRHVGMKGDVKNGMKVFYCFPCEQLVRLMCVPWLNTGYCLGAHWLTLVETHLNEEEKKKWRMEERGGKEIVECGENFYRFPMRLDFLLPSGIDPERSFPTVSCGPTWPGMTWNELGWCDLMWMAIGEWHGLDFFFFNLLNHFLIMWIIVK